MSQIHLKFMNHSVLKQFVTDKTARDGSWKEVVVLLLDSNTPSRTQDKIIRVTKTEDSYDSNGRPCVYGVDDATLTYSLAIHESLVV